MTIRKTSPFWLCASAIIFFIIIILPMRNGVYLRWMDDLSLFEPSARSSASLLDYPGGILQFAGSFLSQFMFHPWLGSLILMVLWAAVVALATKAFRLRGDLSILALTIPLALLASILNIDQAWLTIPSKGYVFSQTLGVAVSLSMLAAYRMATIPGRWVAVGIMIASFPFFGFYSLLAWLMSALTETAEDVRRKCFTRLSIVAAGIPVALFVPILYYHYWEGTWVERKGIWLKGLPDFMFNAGDLYLWAPFIVLTAIMLSLCLVTAIDEKIPHSRPFRLLNIGILLCVAIWCGSCSSKPEQFRAFVLMQHYMQRNEWNRVAAIMDNVREEPSQEMILLANLADDMLGRKRKEREHHPKGSDSDRNPRRNASFVRTALLTVPVSYYIGRPNLSYRWAMEHSVKFGKRAYFLKYMMKCALINGEPRLAQKYNDMLRATLFHREWADRYQRFIDNPALMADDPEFAAIPENTSAEVFF